MPGRVVSSQVQRARAIDWSQAPECDEQVGRQCFETPFPEICLNAIA